MTASGDSGFPDDRHLFLAWSTFTGERATFDAWYDEEHIPQILSAPGMVGAQRFVVDPTKPVPGSSPLDYGHLAMYEINGDPVGFREEVKRQLMSGEMAIPEFMIPPFTTLIMKPVSEILEGRDYDLAADLTDRRLFLAFSRHTGDYDALAHWYDDVHLPQILSIPGMYRVQRFMQADVKPLPGVRTPNVQHLALCELLGDLAPFREAVKQGLISGEITIPDVLDGPMETMFMRSVSPFISAIASETA